MVETVQIKGEYIKLDSLLKYAGVTGSGGDSRILISQGMVTVNGQVETKRGKKVFPGDVVKVEDFGSFKIV